MRRAAAVLAGLAACHGPPSTGGAPDAGAPDAGPDPCVVEAPSVIEPVWIAGGPGPVGDVGAFGKPDALFIDPNGILLVGDEHPDYEEMKLFDVTGSAATPIADLPGWQGIAGITRDARTGRIFVVELLADRVRIVQWAADPRAAPYLEDVGTLGAPAADVNDPADGEFVRPQAVRFDSAGNLYVSDDGMGGGPNARRDIQVFDENLAFVAKIGSGDLREPENFTIDEARDRIYVADETPRDIAVFGFTDHALIERFGAFEGIPNGVDVDDNGVVYVMDEGAGQVVLFDPDTLEEIYRFGALSDRDDTTPGTFYSPDTLIIDRSRDLIAIADQGHDRVQAFRLSDVQRRACLPLNRRLRVTSPARVVSGRAVPVRIEVVLGDRVDRSVFRDIATIDGVEVEIYNGVGTAEVPVAGSGELVLDVRLGELTDRHTVSVELAPAERVVTGTLAGADLTWSPGDGVVRVTGRVAVPAGETLTIEPGTLVMLDAGAGLDVAGDLDARGTEAAPIHLFPSANGQPWSNLFHTGGTAAYAHVFITGGGDASRVGHCCGPTIRVENAAATVDRVVVADGPGKGFYAIDSDVSITDSQFMRLAMGVEINGGRGELSGCHVIELRGPDDDDALYFSGPGEYTASESVFALADDDGVDLEYAPAELSDVIIYGVADKALSISGSDPIVRNCLVLDSGTGIAIKDYRAAAASAPRIERCTIAGHSQYGVRVFASGDEQPDLKPQLRELIIWDTPVSLATVFDPMDITLSYSDLQQLLPTSGAGNFSADPRFADPDRSDYRLGSGSPAATAGENGGPIGWPGF